MPGAQSVYSFLFAIEAALRGAGIHLGRSPIIDRHLQPGALVRVFDQPLDLRATYFMRRHKTARDTRSSSDVVAWIVRLAREYRVAGSSKGPNDLETNN